MSSTQSHDITTGGIAALATGNDRTTQVHGVILGPGDITDGLSGKRTRWPPDALESMAKDGLFEGKPITLADSLDPEQHVGVEATDEGARVTAAVSMDEKMGEVLRTEFDPDAGLVFEGFVMDWVANELVATGLAQVSPVIARELEQVESDGDDGEALFEPTSVDAARDLALVADGAAPSNDIEVGALEPAVAEALSTHFDINVEAGSADGTDAGGDDGPEDSPTGQGQSTSATNGLPSMDDLTPDEQELVAAARQLDDPTVVEAEVREQLNDLEEQLTEHEELIEVAADLEEPEVVAEEELAAMQERIDIVKGMMAEALTEQKGLREATVEAMSFEAIASEFQNDDGGLDVEALTQNPESGSAPAGGGDNDPTDEDKERIQEIDRKLDVLGSAIPQSRIEALQEEAADLAGTDDYEGALEVL